MLDAIATPAIVIDAAVVRRNLARMAAYAGAHHLNLRPHTKTHKSVRLARMQMSAGAAGLTVAKVGEAQVMADAADDLLMAYPAVDPARCEALANLARGTTMRVGIDSVVAAEALGAAAGRVGATIGILVDVDVGHHRTGVQSPIEALNLARRVTSTRGLRLDGLLFFPGHLSHAAPEVMDAELRAIDARLAEIIDGWTADGLEARVVSGGSTPSRDRSHLISRLTEIRPGTYIFNDMNGVHGRNATLDDCAARLLCTVVSDAVPGQVVLDAGSKALTSDRCGPAPDAGHGHVVEYPDARITKLSEEHAQVDVTACSRRPAIGDRVTVIPNHICPCINLQDRVWWLEPGQPPEPMQVDARGRLV